MSGRHSGKIVHFDPEAGYAEVSAASAPFGRLSVFEGQLRLAGIFPPKLGQSVDFEVGADPATHVTAAINLAVPRTG
jgi:hypothetical protein